MTLRIPSLSIWTIAALSLAGAAGCGTDQVIGQGQLAIGGAGTTGGAGTGGSNATGGAPATGGALATGGASCATCPPAVTCEYEGTTYSVGDIISTHVSGINWINCSCLEDGTVGDCAGGMLLSCVRGGLWYQSGQTFTAACGSCVCNRDGTWGRCTGTCGDCGDTSLREKYTTCTSATDATSCAAASGSWTETLSDGIPSGLYHCACATGDEGCACNTTEQCVSGCYYSNGAGDLASCNESPNGQCGQFTGGCAVVVSDSSCHAMCE